MSGPDNKRIAKNTAFLYLRMLISVAVSLYSSRIVLETLGVNDFGIYNLVGGIVSLFSFLNGTMSAATMRFLNYEMGAGDAESLKKTFGTSVVMHLAIAGILLVLAETVGLWFVNSRLDIAAERMLAANWTYQMSVLAAIVTVVQIPYTSEIMAHEDMGTYAYLSLAYTFLKLGAILLLLYVTMFDNLIAYSTLIFIVTAIVGLIYLVYCHKHYKECTGRLISAKSQLKKMVSFSGWDTYGNLAWMTNNQGQAVILNRFGGTALNAAGSLALTVSTNLNGFAGTIISSFRPQIVQQYAQGNYKEMLKLLYNAAKLSILLLMLMVAPVYANVDYILSLWLKEVPEYTAIFSKICLLTILGTILKLVVDAGIHATGRIIKLSFITGTILLLLLPTMWWLVWEIKDPSVVYGVQLVGISFIVLVDSLILKSQLRAFSLLSFWLKCVIIPLLIFVPVLWLCCYLVEVMGSTFLTLCATTAVSTVLIGGVGLLACFDRQTSRSLLNKVLKRK